MLGKRKEKKKKRKKKQTNVRKSVKVALVQNLDSPSISRHLSPPFIWNEWILTRFFILFPILSVILFALLAEFHSGESK